MNGERGCPHAEQAVGLALHALEPADEESMTEHVPTCSICQEQIRQTQDVIRGLAATAEQRDPPAALRASLMSAVTSTKQPPVLRHETPWSAAVPATTESPDDEAPAPRRAGRPTGEPPARPARTGWSAQLSGRRRVIALVATFAVAVVGVAGVTVEMIGRGQQQQQSTLAAPTPEVTRLLEEADRAGAKHAVLHAPDGQVLAAVAQFPTARQVMPIKLQPNERDHTVYVLWGLGDGPPTPVGTFDVSAPSHDMLPVGPVTKTAQYAAYAISIENGRSVPASPGAVVASGEVES